MNHYEGLDKTCGFAILTKLAGGAGGDNRSKGMPKPTLEIPPRFYPASILSFFVDRPVGLGPNTEIRGETDTAKQAESFVGIAGLRAIGATTQNSRPPSIRKGVKHLLIDVNLR